MTAIDSTSADTSAVTKPGLGPDDVPTPGGLRGEVIYFYAFDVAYELERRPIPTLLGQPVAEFALDTSKRAPRQHTFYRPKSVRLPPMDRITDGGTIRVERTIKILPVGAISITFRVPFQVDSLDELTPYHDLRFGDGTRLDDEVRRLAADVQSELEPWCIRPNFEMREEEAYTVFCLHAPESVGDDDLEKPPAPCEQWLRQNRRQVAALLTEEREPRRLSEQEVEESTGKSLSYYDRDLVVIDWDAALLIDEPRFLEETLYLIEMANLQLAEFEAYDRLLDAAVERSYRDLRHTRWRGLKMIAIPPDLRELRIDLARLSDELLNTTKFFGDWHMARIYQALSARFHLSEWHRSIDDKLKTLDDLYQLLRSEQSNRWMLILELSIVVLFIIDLIVLAMGM